MSEYHVGHDNFFFDHFNFDFRSNQCQFIVSGCVCAWLCLVSVRELSGINIVLHPPHFKVQSSASLRTLTATPVVTHFAIELVLNGVL
jgi:hypothetical protein